ncbi:MAG: chemotaxis protein CheA [Oligoflexia bacterium]|nr:chemotaxis protein CheA [Oligoflexia bacterium]
MTENNNSSNNNKLISENDRREMLADFLIDCEVLLKTLNDKLLICEKTICSKGLLADEDVDSMFRAAHSIKGAASFIGLDNIVKLTHEMENILQKIKIKQLVLDENIFNVLFKAFDKLDALFTRTKETSFDDGDIEKEVKDILNVLELKNSNSNTTDNNEKYIQQYYVETIQNIDDFNNQLLNYEKNKDNKNVIDNLFRITHTIKGSSGLLKIHDAHKVSHSMENILNYARTTGKILDNLYISALFAAIDIIKDIATSAYYKKPLTSNIAKIIEELEKLNLIIDDNTNSVDISNDIVEKRIAELTSENKDIVKISLQLEGNLELKGMKGMLLQEKLSRIHEIFLMTPTIEMLDKKDFKNDFTIIFLCNAHTKENDKASVEEIKNLLNIDGVTSIQIEKNNNLNQPYSQQQQQTQHNQIEISTIKVDSNKIDTLLNLSGELVILRAKFSQLLFRLKEEHLKSKELVNIIDDLKNKNIKSFDHSKLDGLDKKFDFKNITQIINTFDETTSSLGKMASEIQTGVMQTRMIPIEGIFNRFKRTVRDISHELNKKIELVTKGEETELDKKIIDSLGEPLTHMIRNAADHGIEDRETRIAAGKPEQGTIYLSASHKGNSICIEVADDGKGIDHQKVFKSAISKGVISEEKAQMMSKEDILNLIFLPGFSTANKVTGISGRGVGMDVVKTMINSVNGIVEINTEVGSGTSFLLKIPLTLAIIQALNVVVGAEVYSIPIESVVEIIKVHPFDIYSVDGNETVKLREHALSLIELYKVIHTKKPIDINKKIDVKSIVVITDGQKQVGLVIDDLIGKDEMVIKSLSEHFGHVKGITGASILGDGRIALILDPLNIIKEI